MNYVHCKTRPGQARFPRKFILFNEKDLILMTRINYFLYTHERFNKSYHFLLLCRSLFTKFGQYIKVACIVF